EMPGNRADHDARCGPVDRLDQQAVTGLAAYEARNPPQSPRNLEPSEDTRGAADRSATPRSRIGGAEGARTPDPKTASLVLSQLSYSPTASTNTTARRRSCQDSLLLAGRFRGWLH